MCTQRSRISKKWAELTTKADSIDVGIIWRKSKWTWIHWTSLQKSKVKWRDKLRSISKTHNSVIENHSVAGISRGYVIEWKAREGEGDLPRKRQPEEINYEVERWNRAHEWGSVKCQEEIPRAGEFVLE